MKFYVEVYGCTANKSDASLVRGLIQQKKHQIVDSVNAADVIVVLTCTVINTTEQRMLSRLKELKKTGKKIIVSGCMPAVQSNLIKKVLPNALQVKPTEVQFIIDYFEKKEKNFFDKNKTFFPKIYDDINAPIMVSEGCMFSCSYCLTCKARGKLRSFPFAEIKNNVKDAISQGCKEIRVTAQDTASYGVDIGLNLGVLLKEIVKISGDYRVRVGMMNPYTLKKNYDEIIEGFQDTKVYNFVHLPVQSGSNSILRKMNRKYKVEEFEEIVNKFRDFFPDVTLATDIIVGFPTENEQNFQETVSLLEKVKPDITNITRFSARPLTEAKKMKGRVDTKISKERSRILTKLCSNISKENNEKFVGKNFDVLITERGKNNTWVGRTGNYKPVVLKKKNLDIGQTVNVKILKAENTYLVGNI